MPRPVVAYVSDVPRIEITHGVVHICDRSGDISIDRAMSINTFKEHIKRCEEALERYADGERDVLVN